MSDMMIEIKDLHKSFKVSQRQAGMWASVKSLFSPDYKMVSGIERVNMQVRKGEIRGLLGPNGAGKSTTIKIMSGILYPTSGEVRVMGYVPWLEREQFVRRIGVLFGQKTQLWWDLPPLDTFSLYQEMYGIPKQRYDQMIEELISLLNIEEVVMKPVRQLSLGERMKCELVCALLHEPPLIFLDEPTIGLDIISKETIRSFIKEVNRTKGTTFLITTHDLADVEDLCEHVTIVNKGTVVFDDTMEKLKGYHDRKTIDLTFTEPVSEGQLAAYQVTSFSEAAASIEVTVTGHDLKQELHQLLDRLPVKDIRIQNMSIERIIKEIYTS